MLYHLLKIRVRSCRGCSWVKKFNTCSGMINLSSADESENVPNEEKQCITSKWKGQKKVLNPNIPKLTWLLTPSIVQTTPGMMEISPFFLIISYTCSNSVFASMTFLLSLDRFSQSRLQVYGKRQFVPRDHFFPFRAFSHDVMAAILVFRNNETIVMSEFYTNSVGMELFS